MVFIQVADDKMAPFIPEEVDLFTAPHLRMKELVDEYSTMVQPQSVKIGLKLLSYEV